MKQALSIGCVAADLLFNSSVETLGPAFTADGLLIVSKCEESKQSTSEEILVAGWPLLLFSKFPSVPFCLLNEWSPLFSVTVFLPSILKNLQLGGGNWKT